MDLPAPAVNFGRVSQRRKHVMPDTHALMEHPSQGQLAVYDAIVIGAGISGMYMLYRLRELGMTARVFEAGTNVGGTWYWNRYPGARFTARWQRHCAYFSTSDQTPFHSAHGAVTRN